MIRNLILTISVMKALRSEDKTITLSAAKIIVDNCPFVVEQNLFPHAAEKLKAFFERNGAIVEVR